ncbi:hypothetical protein Q31b_21950 [Novipirellula aureliae]|uniref:Uncharacterized protein n=1 Tax=Novipirellula aureliae TaxID=2527966 RepID=A0A5C6E5D3_9BACT|nr:hypothetical protein Q31b_21950 [Novipirellula aureliae]
MHLQWVMTICHGVGLEQPIEASCYGGLGFVTTKKEGKQLS